MYLTASVRGPACSFGLCCVWSCHILDTSVCVERRSSESTSQGSGLKQNPEVIQTPKSWLSLHKCQAEKPEIQTQSYGRVRVAFYMCEDKRAHFRPPSLVSRERLYRLLGIYANDQGSNSLVFLIPLQSCKRMGLVTR